MSLFSKKKSSDYDEQPAGSPGKSKAPLLVLLLIVVVFGYLYFFTSLIVPHEEPKPVAVSASPEVKQSMPPKTATAPPGTAPEVKKGDEKPAAVPAPAAAVQAPAPAPAAAAKPAAPAATPAPAAKPATPAPAPAAVKPAPAPPAAAPAAKTVAPAPAPSAAKPAAPKPVPAAEKKESAKADKKVKTTAAKPKKAVTYVLFAGEFPAGDETAAAMAKLAAAGVKPVVKSDRKKGRTMNRLYYNVYTDYDNYRSELDKLKKSATGAFGVEKDGKYYLYAGSLSTKAKAEKEKQALAAKGVNNLQIQTVTLALNSVRLTAGNFKTKGDAAKAAAKLKQAGLAVKVLPKGE